LCGRGLPVRPDHRPVPNRQETIMFAHLPRRGPHPHTAPRLAAGRARRLASGLAAVICAVLASAAVVPTASAMIPIEPGGGPAAPAPAVRVVIEGGMAGWQIALIALG